MDKNMNKKYAMLQIDAEVHQLLKSFCKEKGYKMNGLVESLIKEKVSPNAKPLPSNILKSN
jgi:predicted HicB family RNase H-like nuclease